VHPALFKTHTALVENGCCAVLLFQLSARVWTPE